MLEPLLTQTKTSDPNNSPKRPPANRQRAASAPTISYTPSTPSTPSTPVSTVPNPIGFGMSAFSPHANTQATSTGSSDANALPTTFETLTDFSTSSRSQHNSSKTTSTHGNDLNALPNVYNRYYGDKLYHLQYLDRVPESEKRAIIDSALKDCQDILSHRPKYSDERITYRLLDYGAGDGRFLDVYKELSEKLSPMGIDLEILALDISDEGLNCFQHKLLYGSVETQLKTLHTLISSLAPDEQANIIAAINGLLCAQRDDELEESRSSALRWGSPLAEDVTQRLEKGFTLSDLNDPKWLLLFEEVVAKKYPYEQKDITETLLKEIHTSNNNSSLFTNLFNSYTVSRKKENWIQQNNGNPLLHNLENDEEGYRGPLLKTNNNALTVQFVHTNVMDTSEHLKSLIGKIDTIKCMFGVLSHIPDRVKRQETLKLFLDINRPSGNVTITLPSSNRFPSQQAKFNALRQKKDTGILAPNEEIELGNATQPGDFCYKKKGRPIFYHVYTAEEAREDMIAAGFTNFFIGISHMWDMKELVRDPELNSQDHDLSTALSMYAKTWPIARANQLLNKAADYFIIEALTPDTKLKSPEISEALCRIGIDI